MVVMLIACGHGYQVMRSVVGTRGFDPPTSSAPLKPSSRTPSTSGGKSPKWAETRSPHNALSTISRGIGWLKTPWLRYIVRLPGGPSPTTWIKFRNRRASRTRSGYNWPRKPANHISPEGTGCCYVSVYLILSVPSGMSDCLYPPHAVGQI